MYIPKIENITTDGVRYYYNNVIYGTAFSIFFLLSNLIQKYQTDIK